MNGPMIVIIVGSVATLAGLLFLFHAHRTRKLDPTDVVMEPDKDGVRKASIRKIGEAVALGASTFVVVYDALDGSNEWILFAYLGAWVSRTLFGMIAQAKAGAINAASQPAGR